MKEDFPELGKNDLYSFRDGILMHSSASIIDNGENPSKFSAVWSLTTIQLKL